MKLKAHLYVALGITIFIFACKSENNQTKFPTPIVSACDSNSFSKHVKPIIDLNCASSTSCHATGALNVEFTSYDLMVPFFAGIKDRVFVKKDMPKGGVLTADQLAIINCWYEKGNKNN